MILKVNRPLSLSLQVLGGVCRCPPKKQTKHQGWKVDLPNPHETSRSGGSWFGPFSLYRDLPTPGSQFPTVRFHGGGGGFWVKGPETYVFGAFSKGGIPLNYVLLGKHHSACRLGGRQRVVLLRVLEGQLHGEALASKGPVGWGGPEAENWCLGVGENPPLCSPTNEIGGRVFHRKVEMNNK